MTYAIAGTALILQPETGKWIGRDSVGIDGSGHPIYPAVRKFEMRWGLMSPAEFQQIQNFYNAIGNTGTYVVALPEYGATTYVFKSYSGCTLREPEVEDFFEQYLTNATLLVLNVTT